MLFLNWFHAPAFLAHEVYVLTPDQISADEQSPKVRLLDALNSANNLKAFVALVIGIGLLLALAYFLKSQTTFQRLGKFIDKGTQFAPDLIRIVFGASLIFAASNQAIFGPELPIDIFSFHKFISPFMYISGVALILGLGTRLFGILTALFWCFTFLDRGWYMLTYINYLGESLALIWLWRQKFSIDRILWRSRKTTADANEKWSMPAARILFGFSILYAAINVKFVTTALSSDVAQRYELSRYFHFDPLFIVLGAALIESLIAVLYMLGLFNRLNTIVFVSFIVASIWFFKEDVWPHYLLLGLAAGIFLHKPDVLALDRHFRPKRRI